MNKYYFKYLKYKSKYLKLSQIGGNLTEIVNSIVILLGEPIYGQDKSNESLYIGAGLNALGMVQDKNISLEANGTKVLTRLIEMKIPELAKKFYLDENTTLKQICERTIDEPSIGKTGWAETNFKKLDEYKLKPIVQFQYKVNINAILLFIFF